MNGPTVVVPVAAALTVLVLSCGRIGFQVHHPAEWVEYKNVILKAVR